MGRNGGDILPREEFCNRAPFGGDHFKSPFRSYGATESKQGRQNSSSLLSYKGARGFMFGLEGESIMMVTLELGFGGVVEFEVLFSGKFDLGRSGPVCSTS